MAPDHQPLEAGGVFGRLGKSEAELVEQRFAEPLPGGVQSSESRERSIRCAASPPPGFTRTGMTSSAARC